MRTTVEIKIDAPIEAVWAAAIDFASHPDWQPDAISVEFETDQREGPGTVLLVESRVGPLRTIDRLTITGIEEPHLISVNHIGAVSGNATWQLAETGSGTLFRWTEELHFPWFFGWILGEAIAKPILKRFWNRNLRNLKRRIEVT